MEGSPFDFSRNLHAFLVARSNSNSISFLSISSPLQNLLRCTHFPRCLLAFLHRHNHNPHFTTFASHIPQSPSMWQRRQNCYFHHRTRSLHLSEAWGRWLYWSRKWSWIYILVSFHRWYTQNHLHSKEIGMIVSFRRECSPRIDHSRIPDTYVFSID